MKTRAAVGWSVTIGNGFGAAAAISSCGEGAYGYPIQDAAMVKLRAICVRCVDDPQLSVGHTLLAPARILFTPAGPGKSGIVRGDIWRKTSTHWSVSLTRK